MIVFELLGIIAVFCALIFLITNFLDKRARRRVVALGAVAALAFLFNAGAMIYNLVYTGANDAFDYFIALVRGVQYTAGLLVFEDNFSSLGVLTGYEWFKIVYYAFLGVAYFLYSLTLISLLSYRFVSKIKLFFARKERVYAFTCLNEKSLMLAASLKEKKPKAPLVFTLNNFTQTDENKKLLRKLKDERYCLYVCGKGTEQKKYLGKFPLLKRFGEASVFCLDENSESNISFCRDFAGERLEIYALTEEEFSGSVYLRKDNVHIIKQHDLTAKMLASAYPCFKNVYNAEDGEEINVLILGRGRSGNEIFKNLFIANQFRDIKLRVTVFDGKDKDGFYRLQYPGIYGCDNVRFVKTDIYSQNFIAELSGYLKPDNYIVISLGDDKRNIEVANALYNYILTGSDKKASIYAHVRAEKNKTLLQSVSMGGISVTAFGHESQVFNFDIVVAEFMDLFAKAVNENYNRANPEKAKSWSELSEFTKSSNRAVGLGVGAKLYSLGLEVADMADEREEVDLESLTEEENLRAAQEEHLRWNAFHLVNGWTKMSIAESRAYGEDKKVRKSEEKRKSLSLVGWDELKEVSEYLGEDVQSYDYLWKNAFTRALHIINKKVVRRAEERV